ncbi:MAG TPA: sigma-70 family RNA polymerase sigma factor [Polyangia bacterium]|nr:sigma-70 family RNA polymerase sigma factor [Polyangia bacterium]
MTQPNALELDELTLRRAQRGEEAACRRLVERHERAVFALLGRLLGPRGRRERVEDLAQETFLRVFRALANFDAAGPARLSTWILTIATRVGLDELARHERVVVPLDGAREVASHARADSEAERRQVGRALERAVEELAPPFRAVFLLREIHELDYDEIARALEIDPGTVKSRLSRARAALRDALEDVKP